MNETRLLGVSRDRLACANVPINLENEVKYDKRNKYSGVRKPPLHHPGRMVGVRYSLTAKQLTRWESSLERDAILIADWDPSISMLKTQPQRVQYDFEGRRRSYTPDLAICRNGQNFFVEVKPAARAIGARFAGWVEVIKTECIRLGYQFEVWTDTEIRRQPRLDNVRFLLRFQQQDVCTERAGAICEVVDRNPGIRIADLVENLDTTVGPADIYGLMVQHALQYDINLPINLQTTLRGVAL